MMVISSKEFAANQQKYFDLAADKEVYVRNGKKMFVVSIANQQANTNDYFHKGITIEDILKNSTDYADASEYEEILEPDEDFYRAISMEELRERLHRVVDKLYAKA